MAVRDPASLYDTIAALGRRITHLARNRPDDLGDLVLLGHGCEIELRAMPDALAPLCGAVEAMPARIA